MDATVIALGLAETMLRCDHNEPLQQQQEQEQQQLQPQHETTTTQSKLAKTLVIEACFANLPNRHALQHQGLPTYVTLSMRHKHDKRNSTHATPTRTHNGQTDAVVLQNGLLYSSVTYVYMCVFYKDSATLRYLVW